MENGNSHQPTVLGIHNLTELCRKIQTFTHSPLLLFVLRQTQFEEMIYSPRQDSIPIRIVTMATFMSQRLGIIWATGLHSSYLLLSQILLLDPCTKTGQSIDFKVETHFSLKKVSGSQCLTGLISGLGYFSHISTFKSSYRGMWKMRCCSLRRGPM